MNTVNANYIDDIMGHLTEIDDYDTDFDYTNIDSDDENIVKEIISSKLKPNFEEMSDDYKGRFKLSLSYFLTTNKLDFEGLFYSNLVSFAPPSEPKYFFAWMWEEFFGNESYELANPENYKEVDDIYEPTRYGSSK